MTRDKTYVVEVWIEKSTQNDWLVPLCQRRGVNLVVGIGEQSETRSRELALRSAECAVPVRIIYLSDFDPGGRSMPKAVARKVEFTIAKFGLDVDLQLIPLALTPDQCRALQTAAHADQGHREAQGQVRADLRRRRDRAGRAGGSSSRRACPPARGRARQLSRRRLSRPRVGARYQEQRLRSRKIEAEVKAEHADEIEEIEDRLR